MTVDVLTVTCPHCGHTSTDDLEVLDTGVRHRMRCESCKNEFWFLALECPSCLNEETLSTKAEPTDAQVSAISCSLCGTLITQENDDSEEEIR